MTIGEIVNALDGVLNTAPNAVAEEEMEKQITGVSTDSRSIRPGELFVALPGESFDGHNFINTAFEKGAACCLVCRQADAGGTTVRVGDTYAALKALAEYYRKKFSIPVIAITGSVGKTTTKDLVGAVMAQKLNVLVTEGNLNNEIGLPLMVMRLNSKHQGAVLEMGMNHFGEISNLSKIARPNICIITNIGVAHMENLGSREGILKAKAEIFDYMAENGCAILNGDDGLLRSLGREDAIYYGLDPGNDVYADNLRPMGFDGAEADINYKDICFTVKIPLPGKHMVLNALAAAAAGFLSGLSPEQIRRGIEGFKAPGMRMSRFKTERYAIQVFDDTYNSNPDSMVAAVDVLAECEGRKAVIMGDMLELGRDAARMHQEMGEYMESKKIDVVIGYGELCGSINADACFTSREEMHQSLPALLRNVEFMLVKGSRGMKLEQTIAWIRNNL